MAFSNELQNTLLKSTSFSKNALVTTTYADDYTVKGGHFLGSDIVTLAASESLTFLLDLSDFTGNSVILQPLALKTSAETVYATLYEGTDYAGGTTFTPFNVNRASTNTAQTKITTASTGTDKGIAIRRHVAFANSGFFSASSGAMNNANITILDTTKKYLMEFTNASAANSTIIEYVDSFFEV